MAGVCGSISAGILIDCDNPIIGGVKDRLILMNLSDISSVTRNVANKQIVEAITKGAGKVGYVYEGQKSSIDAKATLVQSAYSVGFTHELIFRVFSNSPVVKAQLEAMARGQIVAVVENNYRGVAGNASFEIFGLDAGLTVTALETNKSDQDTQGAYVVTLSTNDKFREPHLPSTLFITDYAASLAVFNGLLV